MELDFWGTGSPELNWGSSFGKNGTNTATVSLAGYDLCISMSSIKSKKKSQEEKGEEDEEEKENHHHDQQTDQTGQTEEELLEELGTAAVLWDGGLYLAEYLGARKDFIVEQLINFSSNNANKNSSNDSVLVSTVFSFYLEFSLRFLVFIVNKY